MQEIPNGSVYHDVNQNKGTTQVGGTRPIKLDIRFNASTISRKIKQYGIDYPETK